MANADGSEVLRSAIAEALLTGPGHYQEAVDQHASDRIELIRRLGRAVGREHGIAVRTFVTNLQGGLAEVWVVNAQATDADDELAQLKMRRRMRAAVEAASTE